MFVNTESGWFEANKAVAGVVEAAKNLVFRFVRAEIIALIL